MVHFSSTGAICSFMPLYLWVALLTLVSVNITSIMCSPVDFLFLEVIQIKTTQGVELDNRYKKERGLAKRRPQKQIKCQAH